VGAPEGPTATGGNARVDLAWTPSTTGGVTYDVWRTQDPVSGSYAKVNASPVATASYADTGVTNGQTYYYYVVALDPEGFESRWSNFNSDCAVDGPDCVRAKPLNPNPPAAPTGLVVVDPETGGKLNLSWNANGEPDLKSYTVWWGTAPGQYTQSGSAAKQTTYTLNNLTNGVTYYVAITATNTSDKTSAHSAEKSGTPTWVRGVKSPGFVDSLRVDRSGGDAVLSWAAVTTDIYGKPEGAVTYQVFRGTTPGFDPSTAPPLATGLTALSFTDPGAASSPTAYYYLVRAVDAEGNPGGLGRQLPNGTDALRLDRSGTTPGNVVLSWPAVTTDFDGRPTRIREYRIYAHATPFTRGQIRDGAVPLLTTTTGTSIELTPPAGAQNYSVLVVDERGNLSPF
jgi:hypothetical protein